MTNANHNTEAAPAGPPPRPFQLLDVVNDIQARVCGLNLMATGWEEVPLDRAGKAFALAINDIEKELYHLVEMIEALEARP